MDEQNGADQNIPEDSQQNQRNTERQIFFAEGEAPVSKNAAGPQAPLPTNEDPAEIQEDLDELFAEKDAEELPESAQEVLLAQAETEQADAVTVDEDASTESSDGESSDSGPNAGSEAMGGAQIGLVGLLAVGALALDDSDDDDSGTDPQTQFTVTDASDQVISDAVDGLDIVIDVTSIPPNGIETQIDGAKSVVFNFADEVADETLKLKDGSVLSGEVTVENGTVDATEATLNGVTGVVLNSGLSLTASALKELVDNDVTIASSSQSDSQIDVVLTNDADVKAYNDLVEAGVDVVGDGGESLILKPEVSDTFEGDGEDAAKNAIKDLVKTSFDGEVVGIYVDDNDSIQDAINNAEAGDTIRIAEGTYDESLTIDKSIELVGLGDVKITPDSGTNAVTVDVDDSDGSVLLDGLQLDGSGSGVNNGIKVERTADFDELEVRDSEIDGFSDHAVDISEEVYTDRDHASLVDHLKITGSSLNDNDGDEDNNAQVKLYGFSGALTVEDTSFSHSEGTRAAMEIHGAKVGVKDGPGNTALFESGDWERVESLPAAEINLSGIEIEGDYSTSPVAIYNYSNIDSSGGDSGLSIEEFDGAPGIDFSDATSDWAFINIDKISEGEIDASSWDIEYPDDIEESGAFDLYNTLWLRGPVSDQSAALDTGPVTIVGGDTANVTAPDGSAEPVNLLGGGKDDDEITGGDGNDIITGGAGADTIDGGAGDDTASYAGSAAAVTVDLSDNDNNADGDAAGDVLSNIENVTGSANDDTLTGDDGDNVITGGAGADDITLNGGANTLIYNADVATSSDSNSTDTDTVDNYVIGTDGIRIVATNVSDFEVASDVFDGSGGTADANTYAASLNGDATLTDTSDVVLTTTGVDMTDTEARADTTVDLTGTGGADTLSGGANADTITGGAGADSLTGGDGDDTFVFDGSVDSADVGNDITDFNDAGADDIDFTTNAATGTGTTAGDFQAAEVAEDGGAVSAAGGFAFVTDAGGDTAAGLDDSDVAAFLADVDGDGNSSFEFNDADNVLYLAVTDGTNTGVTTVDADDFADFTV